MRDRVHVRGVGPEDREAVDRLLAAENADRVARLGELLDPREHAALLAEIDGRLAGVATLVAHGDSLEVLTLHAVEPRRGVGTALLAATAEVARDLGCRRVWLVTTNDNLDALRFYQRRGMRLVRVHAGAVDRSRAELKAAIPRTGSYGIPMRDELELALDLGPGDDRRGSR